MIGQSALPPDRRGTQPPQRAELALRVVHNAYRRSEPEFVGAARNYYGVFNQ
jgi:hypothetical protein